MHPPPAPACSWFCSLGSSPPAGGNSATVQNRSEKREREQGQGSPTWVMGALRAAGAPDFDPVTKDVEVQGFRTASAELY